MPSARLWAFERGALWAMNPRDAPALPARGPAAVVCAEARPGEAEALARAMSEAVGEVERRFAAGCRCFAARVADSADSTGEIAGYGWVSRGAERIGELERTLRMKPGEAYIWDCATLPAYRHQGVYTALLRAMTAALRGEGVGRIWIGASLDNHASLRGFTRAGFRPALTITYLRIGRASHAWLTPAASAPPALYAAARWALREERAPARGSLAHG